MHRKPFVRLQHTNEPLRQRCPNRKIGASVATAPSPLLARMYVREGRLFVVMRTVKPSFGVQQIRLGGMFGPGSATMVQYAASPGVPKIA
jgi:hypothetical protein